MAATEQRSGGAGGGVGSVRCYYELLEVERQATDEELKKAYRRLALRWHPDKNPHRVEEATAHFRLVQKAYEVLANRRSRAWYDKHRERILRGSGGDVDGDYVDVGDCVDVFAYFPPSCYEGYGDGPSGFFAVYRRLFARLAAEEDEAAAATGDGGGSAEAGRPTEPPPEMPDFGQSDSDYEATVGPFYARWEQFTSRRQQLQQQQQQQRQPQRTEEVRVLVAFVKAWDPRVFARRADAVASLLAGLAEADAVRATLRQSALAGLAVGVGALVGAAALASRGSAGGGLVAGAAAAGVAYALASHGSFVSLADAWRQMPPARRARLVDRTVETLREFNALETSAWASLLATDANFRARLLGLLRRFAAGGGVDEDDDRDGGAAAVAADD